MAKGIDIGTAWINIVPSFQGMSKSISAELGKVTGDKLEKALSKNVTGGFVAHFKNAMSQSSAAVAKAAADVQVASGRVDKALARQASAAERVKNAQDKLNLAQQKYGADSTQASNAAQRVTKALQAQVVANQKVREAYATLGQAQAMAFNTKPVSVAGAAMTAFGQSAKNVAAKVGGAFADAFKALPGIAAGAFAAATGVIAANLGGAVQRADLLNAFPKVMANVGFSASEASEQIRRISEALDGLPTSTDSLAGVVKGLAPLTGSLERSTDIAIALNDALLAGGASTTIAEAAMEQYRQMLSVGKVDMMAWRSMLRAMPGQMDQISRSILGASASTSDLYDAMQNGTVSFDQFNDALIALDKEGAGGLASFSEQARTAVAGIGTAFGLVKTRIQKASAEVLAAIGVESIAEKINEATSGIVGFGTTIAEKIKALKETGGVSVFSGMFSGLAPVLGAVIGSLGPLLAAIPGLSGVFGGLTGPVGAVIGLFVGMIQNSEKLRAAFGQAFNVLGGVFDQLKPLFAAILGALGPLMGQLGDLLAPLIVFIAQLIRSFVAQIMPILMPFIEKLLDGFSRIIKGLEPVVAFIVNLGTLLMAHAIPVAADVFQIISGLIGGVVDIVAAVVETIGAVLSGDWSAAWEGMWKIVQAAWDMVVGIFTGFTSLVLGYVSQFLGFFSSLWGGAWGSALSTLKQAWDGMAKSVSNGVKTVADYVRQIPQKVRDALGNVGSVLLDAGRRIVEGFISGITSKFQAVKNTLSNLTSLLPDWKGPADLDKVILEKSGELVISGFVRGMESEYNTARKSLAAFTNTLSPAMGPPYFAYDAPNANMAGQKLYLVVAGREFEAYVEDVQARALAPASRLQARELMGI